jgi:hypothetical protein
VDWIPLSGEQFAKTLSSEVSSLASDVQRLYEQYAVTPYQLPCLRDQDSGPEQVFVFAKNGKRLLYFDDVEEDFGVATTDDDGVTREWGNYGPLVRALLVLDEEQSVG